MTKDAYDALTRTQPEWSQNNNLIITSVEEKEVDGKKVNVPRGYIDYDFINPYSYWAKVSMELSELITTVNYKEKTQATIIGDASEQVCLKCSRRFLMNLLSQKEYLM